MAWNSGSPCFRVQQASKNNPRVDVIVIFVGMGLGKSNGVARSQRFRA